MVSMQRAIEMARKAKLDLEHLTGRTGLPLDEFGLEELYAEVVGFLRDAGEEI